MSYLCEGLTHKEIAEKMGIKFSSVKSHTILIYQKLDVSNAVDAMIKIQELGLLR
jgi:DNA-binding NarL/FixJ family response regulator